MFYPYYFPYSMISMRKPLTSYIRILHASPDAPAVDIYANNSLIAKNLPYKGFTPYLSLPAGTYNIKVFPTGKKTNPVLSKNLNIPGNSIFTVAAINKLADIDLFPIMEPTNSIPPNKTMIRFVHLSPNAPSVDITSPNGNKLFENVSFKEITNYIPVSSGTYILEVRPTGTEDIVLYVPNINLKPNRFYSVYAVGLVDEKPPLQALIPLDGNSYLKF